MTINIQSSTNALATLEALTTQANANAGASASSPLLDAASQSDPAPASSIIDLSGGASSALSGLSAGLSTSSSIADVAVAGATSVESLLAQMRQDAVSASDPSVDDDTRAALNAGFQSTMSQIQAALSSAQVGGVNLINGSVNGQLSSQQAPGASLSGVNLSLGGPLIGLASGASLSDPSAAANLADQLGAAVDNVGQAVDQLSAQSDSVQANLALVAQAGLSSGGVNSTLDSDGARLAALSVQQQLSVSGGSIGNQAPQAILALFR